VNTPDTHPRDAVHVIFGNEKVRAHYDAPDPREAQAFPKGLRVLTFTAIVRMKLTRFRLKDPIHVLPRKNKAGLGAVTILDGCRRVGAMRADGETEIDVIIRHDLAEADDVEVEKEFFTYNLNRRQLHQLDKARIALAMYKLQRRWPRGSLSLYDEKEAR
jgi:hypothetical protein